MAINLFFASLLGTWVGLPVISPTWALVGGIILGWPASWAFARHIAALMDQAEARRGN
ncbi:MAG: NnrT protein [Jannaschia sp.]